MENPKTQPKPPSHQPEKEEGLKKTNKKSVLVIEDCATDMTFIRIVLRRLGFDVIEIPHSSKFFGTMWRNAENLFAILMDGHVPDFYPDSSVILPYIKKFYDQVPEIRPVLISTTTDEKVRQKHLENGCSYHVNKETIVDDLTNLFSSLITTAKKPD